MEGLRTRATARKEHGDLERAPGGRPRVAARQAGGRDLWFYPTIAARPLRPASPGSPTRAGVPASRLGRPAHARPAPWRLDLKPHPVGVVSTVLPQRPVRNARNIDVRAPLPLQRTPEGLFSPYDRRNMKARRRNRVSEPDPSKEGPVSKETGLLVPPRRAFEC
jgi:hypothetical protein